MNGSPFQATALAHPNIAFIKYWGNRDEQLRLPLTGSLSMALNGLDTVTQVSFNPGLTADRFILNGVEQTGAALERVAHFLEHVRQLAGINLFAQVESGNNYPSSTGIASSAAAFAALALAATKAAGLELSESELSRLARLGSGSACRSVPGGFAEWLPGSGDADSYAIQIAPPEHWDLVDLIVVVDRSEKAIGSSAGHKLASTSPLQTLRIAGAPERLEQCSTAILTRDFERLAQVVELDSEWMHAVMRTSSPPLYYWTPATEVVIWHVRAWRAQGHAVCATVDAGPNVHVIALAEEAAWAETQLRALPGVLEVLKAKPGGGVKLIKD
ncbi:MAG TPA: diphosphomevalonate decarboxylase [Anaerolineaceae bacterium]|nr:diphosphomevalonate decarboxylase [Anaerolineaceae bacterium]